MTRTSTTSVRTFAPSFSQESLFLTKNYSSNTPGDQQPQESENANEQHPEELPWIDMLESAAKADWLRSTPTDHHDRLKRAYSLLFHIILYLGRPLTKDVQEAEAATQQFLLAFNSAPVTPESEIGRARYAIGLLTKTITNDISTIPDGTPIRTQHPQVFAIADALVPLCEVHLDGVVQEVAPTSGEVVDEGKWQDFWTKAQQVVLALGEELDREGYGISEELMKEAKAEQERKDREAAGPGGGETK
ncbi:hypothetical protein NP233_g2549 [Leucocoprinus birnbaumii]|uniref:Uncharacterized protein n=1 Tax=Leucocoprinus birnbaumii TaxID=56174 RepID=A0AAD5YYQ7_9AGAR|nr:hypothetical protein NP233_g2549 [Leucocoprinus birnbaumii]